MRRPSRTALSITSGVALLTVAAGSATAMSAAAQSPSADLAVSGSVAGGERTVESSHLVAFVFSVKNKGPDAVDSSADLSYVSVQNGRVVDQLCVFPNRVSFNADSPSCEFGTLARGQSARMTLIVRPRTEVSGVTLGVRVCSSNESGIPDPVSANDCATRHVEL